VEVGERLFPEVEDLGGGGGLRGASSLRFRVLEDGGGGVSLDAVSFNWVHDWMVFVLVGV